jgi:hypothetical protein
MCFFIPEMKLSHKIYDVLFSSPSYLCICSKLRVCTSKKTVFSVTEFIYDKTDFFRVISVYISAEVYFGCVIKNCEANRIKFWWPRMDCVIGEILFQLQAVKYN